MSDPAIRRATSADVGPLKTLVRDYIDFYEQPQPSDERLDKLLLLLATGDEAGGQFVAERDGVLVGFATVFLTYDTVAAAKIATMNDLFVVPAMRRTGIGRRLIGRCELFARDKGCVLLQWITAADNVAGQRLYDAVATRTSWVTYNLFL